MNITVECDAGLRVSCNSRQGFLFNRPGQVSATRSALVDRRYARLARLNRQTTLGLKPRSTSIVHLPIRVRSSHGHPSHNPRIYALSTRSRLKRQRTTRVTRINQSSSRPEWRGAQLGGERLAGGELARAEGANTPGCEVTTAGTVGVESKFVTMMRAYRAARYSHQLLLLVTDLMHDALITARSPQASPDKKSCTIERVILLTTIQTSIDIQETGRDETEHRNTQNNVAGQM
ncbi:uncharacterized protein C8Q71DRAFT_382313 [Rhodofomes roseus]|uniref:Uncharacterized protein n=1 Tax=Rhodofomes roseus TaxID=34475 RepID=A0ABQ8K1B2_9APHY|nr:uncharacterized protein C8Q71DRAFT_382313 [Rhodofomes roseus]KAH9830203.1 hypothetical protein C8Q71DRAFT_382313 [Rhodofomes roseus]